MIYRTYVMRVEFADGAFFRAPIKAVNASDATKRGRVIVHETFSDAELARREITRAEIYTTRGEEGCRQ